MVADAPAPSVGRGDEGPLPDALVDALDRAFGRLRKPMVEPPARRRAARAVAGTPARRVQRPKAGELCAPGRSPRGLRCRIVGLITAQTLVPTPPRGASGITLICPAPTRRPGAGPSLAQSCQVAERAVEVVEESAARGIDVGLKRELLAHDPGGQPGRVALAGQHPDQPPGAHREVETTARRRSGRHAAPVPAPPRHGRRCRPAPRRRPRRRRRGGPAPARCARRDSPRPTWRDRTQPSAYAASSTSPTSSSRSSTSAATCSSTPLRARVAASCAPGARGQRELAQADRPRRRLGSAGARPTRRPGRTPRSDVDRRRLGKVDMVDVGRGRRPARRCRASPGSSSRSRWPGRGCPCRNLRAFSLPCPSWSPS